MIGRALQEVGPGGMLVMRIGRWEAIRGDPWPDIGFNRIYAVNNSPLPADVEEAISCLDYNIQVYVHRTWNQMEEHTAACLVRLMIIQKRTRAVEVLLPLVPCVFGSVIHRSCLFLNRNHPYEFGGLYTHPSDWLVLSTPKIMRRLLEERADFLSTPFDINTWWGWVSTGPIIPLDSLAVVMRRRGGGPYLDARVIFFVSKEVTEGLVKLFEKQKSELTFWFHWKFPEDLKAHILSFLALVPP